jgi:hypothetical protein
MGCEAVRRSRAECGVGMAKVVFGLGSSHGPTMKTPTRELEALGQKDQSDPRLDYEALLRWAKPDIAAELMPEIQEERYQRCQQGIARTADLLAQAKPDALVVFSNLHGQTPDYHQQMLALFVGDAIPRMAGGGRPGAPPGVTPPSRPARIFPTDARMAQYLLESLNETGFDIQSCADAQAARMGHEFTEIYDLYEPTGTLPMVPFMISRALPNEPSPKRAYQLGQVLREAIDAWDSDKRVVIMASGGLSHQVLDEELDRLVVNALVEQDAEALCALPKDRLNFSPGTPEILNWVAAAGAMEEVPMTLIDYVPCYRSPASTGHGVTFGYWAV